MEKKDKAGAGENKGAGLGGGDKGGAGGGASSSSSSPTAPPPPAPPAPLSAATVKGSLWQQVLADAKVSKTADRPSSYVIMLGTSPVFSIRTHGFLRLYSYLHRQFEEERHASSLLDLAGGRLRVCLCVSKRCLSMPCPCMCMEHVVESARVEAYACMQACVAMKSVSVCFSAVVFACVYGSLSGSVWVRLVSADRRPHCVRSSRVR